MYENMAREEMDLCGTRGLMPGSDQQTFEVFFPKSLRTKYNAVLFDVWKAVICILRLSGHSILKSSTQLAKL